MTEKELQSFREWNRATLAKHKRRPLIAAFDALPKPVRKPK